MTYLIKWNFKPTPFQVIVVTGLGGLLINLFFYIYITDMVTASARVKDYRERKRAELGADAYKEKEAQERQAIRERKKVVDVDEVDLSSR